MPKLKKDDRSTDLSLTNCANSLFNICNIFSNRVRSDWGLFGQMSEPEAKMLVCHLLISRQHACLHPLLSGCLLVSDLEEHVLQPSHKHEQIFPSRLLCSPAWQFWRQTGGEAGPRRSAIKDAALHKHSLTSLISRQHRHVLCFKFQFWFCRTAAHSEAGFEHFSCLWDAFVMSDYVVDLATRDGGRRGSPVFCLN